MRQKHSSYNIKLSNGRVAIPHEIHYEIGERVYILRMANEEDIWHNRIWTVHQVIGAGIFTDAELPFVNEHNELPCGNGTFNDCMDIVKKAMEEYIS